MRSPMHRAAFLQSAVAAALVIPATEVFASPIRLLGLGSPDGSKPTVFNAINRIPDLSTFAELISLAGLESMLNTGGPFTVFAPPNEAWTKLPKNQMEKLMTHPDRLTMLLTYHMLAEKVRYQDLQTGKYTTVEGEMISVDVLARGFVTVDRTAIVSANVKASNGIVHIVSKVLTKVLRESN
jgi:uncharacterized surface protein with fasciclin (FAS1) repeats